MSYPSSICRWDSNPRPLEHELSPIITRPGLLPYQKIFFEVVSDVISKVSNECAKRPAIFSHWQSICKVQNVP